MQLNNNCKEYLAWSSNMDRKVKQIEQEEIESEKSHHGEIQKFVLQRELDEYDRELYYQPEDEAFKELESRLKQTLFEQQPL